MKKIFQVSVVMVLSLVMFSCSPPGKRKKTLTLNKKIWPLVKKLVKSKGDVNQRYSPRFKKDNNGIPILVWAVAFYDVNSVKLLLKNKANPNIAPKNGSTETPLFEVSASTDLNTAKDEALFRRRSKSAKICKLLVKAKAKIDHVNSFNETPLIKAAGNGREDICSILIAAGAYVNKKNSLDQTALHAAAKSGYWKVVKLLLRKGARAGTKDKLKQTALSLAQKRGDEDLHKKCRQALKGAYANADYNKTIAALKNRR